MKVSYVAAAALLALVYCCSQVQCQSFTLPTECCFGYSSKQIPAKRIKSYKITHPNCRKKAVLLTTLNNSKVCADPDAKHTKEIMEKLDMKNLFGTLSTTAIPTNVTNVTNVTNATYVTKI
ncbi:eotaxin-like [Engraulis encrasicolus]|uniref:eotaxin-like n=1 Tax=Engraulis encrasicolus TaxID=184585 RepID=UPI002FD6BE48